jgi:hypothetical protein
MIVDYPDMKVQIAAYFLEYEMAIMTAMCRNDMYDIEVINILRTHLKKHISELMENKTTAVYYKISAILIIVNYKIFAVIFKLIRKRVGR